MGADVTGEVRRRLVDPGKVVEALGLLPGALRQPRGFSVLCPRHAERTPSCSVTEGPDGDGVRVHCFGCGFNGNVFHLVAAVRGLDVTRDFRRVLEESAALAGAPLSDFECGVPPPPSRPSPRVLGAPRTPCAPNEIQAFYDRCRPVTDDPEVRRYVRGRGWDAATLADRDLARALPDDAALPRWARYRGAAPTSRSWVETGHRLVLPMYDDAGRIATVRARRIVDSDLPKSLPPAGHTVPSSVLADPLGRLLLSTGQAPSWCGGNLTVVVSEGEPDFLTVATYYGDDESAPAVLGLVGGGQRLHRGGPACGSWGAAIAARIPDGAQVVVRTHLDTAGDEYASAVAETLGGRCRLLRRSE